MRAELETRRKADSASDNKHHKYTLDKALQVVLEFDDESKYSYLSD